MTTKATRNVLDLKNRAITEFVLERGIGSSINGTVIGNDDPDEGYFTNLYADNLEFPEGGGLPSDEVTIDPFPGLPSNITNIQQAIEYLITNIQQSMIPSGTIVNWPNLTLPTGYLLCNGQTVSRITYATLFASIGTRYGVGDGSTTFGIPDLRGVFIRGLADGSNRETATNRVIGSYQDYATARPQTTNPNRLDSSGNPGSYTNAANPTTVAFARVANVGEDCTKRFNDSGGSGLEMDIINAVSGDLETRPRNVAMRFLIKV